jgi:hypothetical protein
MTQLRIIKRVSMKEGPLLEGMTVLERLIRVFRDRMRKLLEVRERSRPSHKHNAATSQSTKA